MPGQPQIVEKEKIIRVENKEQMKAIEDKLLKEKEQIRRNFEKER